MQGSLSCSFAHSLPFHPFQVRPAMHLWSHFAVEEIKAYLGEGRA